MNWFGESWGAPMCNPKTHVETPVGDACAWCDESIAHGDAGLVLPYVSIDGRSALPYHYACWMRTVTGSVGHQNGNCHCYGGKDAGDPPRRTRRQAAEYAVDKFLGMLR